MGLFVGDAAGAPLEFYNRPITDKLVSKLMRMPGGGRLNVAPGQFTDDSELAIHLLKAIWDKDPAEGFPSQAVAKEYIQWYNSEPFDMGGTCRKAFGFATSDITMIENAQKYSMSSQANGALMRIAPLALWARKQPVHVIMEYARKDTALSHPNVICQDVSSVFCAVIAYLANNPSDRNGALCLLDTVSKDIHPIVKEWIEESKCDLDTIKCEQNIGHVRHAFVLALHFLRFSVDFETAIFHTLMKGGDSDTNACIVGALMGVLYGYDNIPKYMRQPVENFDCTTWNIQKTLCGYNRPNTYLVSDVLVLLNSL